jgi:hypothetical protein
MKKEQILEYAEQARLYAKSVIPQSIDDPIGWNYEYHKKFAELIVQECLTVVGPNTVDKDKWMEWPMGAAKLVKTRIKEHFEC